MIAAADPSHGAVVFGLAVIWVGLIVLALSVPRRGEHRPTRQHTGPGKRGRL